MADSSNQNPDEGKVGKIPVAIITAIIAAIATIIVGVISNQDRIWPPPAAPTAILQASCMVSGFVYSADTKLPLQGMQVGYVPVGSGYSDEELFTYAATTNPSGMYSFDCSSLAAVPTMLIAFNGGAWGRCINVSQYKIRLKQEQSNVNLYVNEAAAAMMGKLFGLPKNSSCLPPNSR